MCVMQLVRKHRWLLLTCLMVAVVLACVFFALFKVSDIVVAGQTTPASVSVQAQIETDGSLSVVDQRTFECSESTHLDWEISKTTTMSDTAVTAVRVIVEDEGDAETVALEAAQLTEEDRAKLRENEFDHLPENKWYFDVDDSWFYVSLSSEFAGKTVVVEVSYVQRNAVFVYDDVAELYWDYLPSANVSAAQSLFSATEQVPDINISAQVLIPSAVNAEIADRKTVWGWGHGFEGTVEFLDVGAYIYVSKAASLTKTSQAHIIFPASCLVNYDKTSQTNAGGARKNFAISEEESWTDEYAVQVCNSAVVSVWVCAAAFLVTIMAAIAYAGVLRKYSRILGDTVSLKEQLAFDEKCCKFQKRMLVLSVALLLVALSLHLTLAFSLCLQLTFSLRAHFPLAHSLSAFLLSVFLSLKTKRAIPAIIKIAPIIFPALRLSLKSRTPQKIPHTTVIALFKNALVRDVFLMICCQPMA